MRTATCSPIAIDLCHQPWSSPASTVQTPNQSVRVQRSHAAAHSATARRAATRSLQGAMARPLSGGFDPIISLSSVPYRHDTGRAVACFKMTDDLHYRVLKHLDAHPDATQRSLAKALGISLGGTNYCLRALIDQGWIKVENFRQALQNRPITLYGDGTQTRSFCYVDDLIEGFVRLMHSPDELTGPINLGNPGEFTMIELAEAVKELTGSRSELVHQPLPQDDPKQRQPGIRDYIHVTDLAQAHVLALQALERGADSTRYNLGNGHGFSVREVIDQAARVTGKTIPVAIGPRRPGDPPRLVGNATRIRRNLGWQPQYADLDAILRTAWRWHCTKI